MIKVDEVQFVRPVGGRWSVDSITGDRRGFQCFRSDDGETFYVRHDQGGRTITVPRSAVLWHHDDSDEALVAAFVAPAGGAVSAEKKNRTMRQTA